MSSTRQELLLASERHLKYQGTAKVDISQISFDKLSPSTDKLERLRRIFREEGCLRENVRNHVPCLVSHKDLLEALQRAGSTQIQLHTNTPEQYPHLEFADGRLRGLHGFHRIETGRQLLPPSDRWWTVDIYFDNISDDLHTTLIEEYSNEKCPDDGEGYCKLRQYQREGNVQFQRRWWARLSVVKAGRLRQLWRNDILSSKFDDLLVIPGVWEGMRLGSLGKVLGMKCVEREREQEVVNYLTHIKVVWSSFVAGSRSAMLQITRHDVKMLESRAPGACITDARQVEGWVLSGEVFRSFSRQERDDIWSRIKQFNGLIPSLYTFFEDCKYLEACAHCLHRLVEVSRDSTLRQAMKHIFMDNHHGQLDFALQTAKNQFRIVSEDLERRFELSYRQLWLYAMRYQHKVGRESKRRLARPTMGTADEKALHGAAFLAQKSGLVSPQITKLVDEHPDRLIAQNALLKARNQSHYRYEPSEFEALISTIVGCFKIAKRRDMESPCELQEQNVINIKSRCGVPPTQTNKQDRRYLFVDYLDTGTVSTSNGVSSLFVRRCVFHAFLGNPEVKGLNRNEEIPAGNPVLEEVQMEDQPPCSEPESTEKQGEEPGILEQPNRGTVERRRMATVKQLRSAKVKQKGCLKSKRTKWRAAALKPNKKKTAVQNKQQEAELEQQKVAEELQQKLYQDSLPTQSSRDANKIKFIFKQLFKDPTTGQYIVGEDGYPFDVTSGDYAKVERLARKCLTKHTKLFPCDRDGRNIKPSDCFEYARKTGEYIVYLKSEDLTFRKNFCSKIQGSKEQSTTNSSEDTKVTFKQLFKDPNTGKYAINTHFFTVTVESYSEIENITKHLVRRFGLFACDEDGKNIKPSEWFKFDLDRDFHRDFQIYLKTEDLKFYKQFSTLQETIKQFRADDLHEQLTANNSEEPSSKKQRSKEQNPRDSIESEL